MDVVKLVVLFGILAAFLFTAIGMMRDGFWGLSMLAWLATLGYTGFLLDGFGVI